MLQENGGTHLKEERDSIHFVVFLIERDAHSHTCTHTRTPTADGYCCFLVLRSMLTSKLPPLHGNSGGSGRICTSSSDDAGEKKRQKDSDHHLNEVRTSEIHQRGSIQLLVSYAVDELRQLNPSGDICLATVDAFGAKSETL